MSIRIAPDIRGTRNDCVFKGCHHGRIEGKEGGERKGRRTLALIERCMMETHGRCGAWVRKNLCKSRSKSAGFYGERRCLNKTGSWNAESLENKCIFGQFNWVSDASVVHLSTRTETACCRTNTEGPIV